MGNCTNVSSGITVSETAITLPKFSSETDFIFDNFDKKYNFLKDISLFDFLISLQNLKFSKTPGETDYITEDDPENIFLSFIDIAEVQTFLDNTVGKHPRHYNEKDSENMQLFGEYFKMLIDYNIKGQKDYYKKNPDIDDYKSNLKKYMLIQLGLLYCFSKDMDKINVFFSSVADENCKISKNKYLDLFVYMLIFTASFSNFSTCFKLNQQNDGKLPTMKIEDRPTWDDYFGLYQVEKVFNLFKETLFAEKEELNFDQFYTAIQHENLAWILTLQGIRSKCAVFKKDPLEAKNERNE